LAIVTFGLIPARRRWWAIIGLAVTAVLGLIVTPSLTSQHQDLQYYLFHGSQQWHDQRGSDFEHAASLQTGIQSVSQQPLGHGFGTAGPTFFYTGNGRVIENYYLQLGYELGILGMVLFVVLLTLIVQRLWKQGQQHPASLAVAAAVIGISVNALVLPAWTDSTTALVTWTLAGALLSHTKPETTHV
jgi:cell division protein FtsW (lipid II flippase)